MQLQSESREEFAAKLEYIAEQGLKLSKKVLGRELPIDTLTIFAPTEGEYERASAWARQQGTESPVTHGKTLYVEPDQLTVFGYSIKYLGVRDTVDDSSRSEVGYVDYPVDDYEVLVKQTANNPYLTAITSGRGQSLVEFRHPDFDILGYAADASQH